jgi:hypothetical protein
MEGRVICLENDAKSIESEVEIISHYGLEPKLVTRPRALGNYLEGEQAIDPRTVKAFVLDMHMPKIKDLSEISLPAADTLGGEAVGLAVAEQYLRRPKSRYRRTPLAFLTGFSIDPPVMSRIRALQRDGGNVIVLRKTTDLALFDKFVRSMVDEKESKYSELPAEVSDYKEGVDIALRILGDLGFQNAQQMALLGYTQDGDLKLGDIARRIKGTVNVDIQDRVALIIDIKSRLEAIFGTDARRQQRWLKTRQGSLGKRSPMELLKGGHQHDLAHVAALIRKITG